VPRSHAKRFVGSCERCRRSFESSYAEQRFCSHSCASRQPHPNRRRRPILPRACACGVLFTPKREEIKFCSPECVKSFGGRTRTTICRHCAMGFETRSALQAFCSQRCRFEARKLRTVRQCQRCGKPYNGFDQRRKYCSRECGYATIRERKGADAPQWKGGRSVAKFGYVWARAVGHPRGRPNWPYVLEHILVMEKTLGRYLLPFERVHHRNGRRDDNRPENLELWKIKDPAGVRAADYHCAGCTCDGQPVVLLGPNRTVTEAR
jgi:hypothetical protein